MTHFSNSSPKITIIGAGSIMFKKNHLGITFLPRHEWHADHPDGY